MVRLISLPLLLFLIVITIENKSLHCEYCKSNFVLVWPVCLVSLIITLILVSIVAILIFVTVEGFFLVAFKCCWYRYQQKWLSPPT